MSKSHSVPHSERPVLPAGPGQGASPLLVAGPCAMESREQLVSTAQVLQDTAAKAGFDFIFKASFDKANRSSLDSWRGPGMQAGLELLAELRAELGLTVLCDIHEPDQAATVAGCVDILQVPAFLCRQTDLLLSAAATGRPVNLKKGQFLAPWQVQGAVDKLRRGGATTVLLTERGTSFGHGDLVVDFRGLLELQATGCPTLFDASHSAQQPGAHGDRSGGERRWSPLLARAAAASGFDGLYLEVHPCPQEALSDPDTQWPLNEVGTLLEHFKAPWRACRDLPPASADS